MPRNVLLRFCLCVVASAASVAVRADPVTVSTDVLQAEQSRIETMAHAAPSVVAIFATTGEGGGSGVLIDSSGYTVTNFHVVEGQGNFLKAGLNDGVIYDAVLVGVDPTGDVALIKLLGRDDFPAARIGDSDLVRVGDSVFAMGNPFLLATDFQPTVTFGMVSGTHRYQYPAGTFLEYTDCLQVDASINPGNSGGPLFNSAGELIGINGRISVEKRGRVNVGAGYAISINQVMHFLDHLKSGRIVDHATLGATVSETSDGSVIITHILESSEVYRRGLRRGDEIASFAGRPMRSANQFKNILGIYPKGWKVPIVYRRDAQRFTTQVRLMGLHRRAELIGSDDAEGPGPDPRRMPHPPMERPAPEVPSEFQHLFEARTGFANYHFNAQHQERLVEQLSRWGDYAETPAGWAIIGSLSGQPVEIRLQPDVVAARIGSTFAVQKLDADPEDLPAGSSGLLTALDHFRHLLRDPDEFFTERYYLGSEPLDGGETRVDVLITTRGEVTCRWYFDKADGRFLGFDTALTEYVDACEIRVSEMKSLNGRQLPSVWTIHSGATEFGQLEIETLQFFEPTPTEGSSS